MKWNEKKKTPKHNKSCTTRVVKPSNQQKNYVHDASSTIAITHSSLFIALYILVYILFLFSVYFCCTPTHETNVFFLSFTKQYKHTESIFSFKCNSNAFGFLVWTCAQLSLSLEAENIFKRVQNIISCILTYIKSVAS